MTHLLPVPKKLFLVGTILLASATGAYSQTDIQAKPGNSAYVQDGRGVIARSPSGLCWRTGYWTPADAIAGCDGELVPPVANPTAPPLASNAPASASITPPSAPKRCDFAVTLGSDEAFSFNKAALSPAAKKRIDSDVIAKLGSCAKVEIVLVTGHTDRLGTQQYNQKLSEKRADSVAAYLKSQGVTAEIDTLGAGKTQSVKACNDTLARKQLIDCLAPNRRVAVEVRGIAK